MKQQNRQLALSCSCPTRPHVQVVQAVVLQARGAVPLPLDPSGGIHTHHGLLSPAQPIFLLDDGTNHSIRKPRGLQVPPVQISRSPAVQLCFDAVRYLLGWAMPPKFSLLKFLKQKLAPEEKNKNSVIQVRCHLCVMLGSGYFVKHLSSSRTSDIICMNCKKV